MGQVLDEMSDREERNCNLIIHNIPESKAANDDTKEYEDRGTVLDLVNNELKQAHITEAHVSRLKRLGGGRGHNRDNKPRLILIQLTSPQLKWDILRRASTLRKSEVWPNIYISPDLTPKQREAGKTLRTELRRRREEGETNIYIHRNRIETRPNQDDAQPDPAATQNVVVADDTATGATGGPAPAAEGIPTDGETA